MPVKLFTDNSVTCKRNKSLIVSDQTIAAERLGNFFSSLGKATKNVGNRTLKNPGRALETAASFTSATASKNPKQITATAPGVIKFAHQGKD